VLEQRDSLWVKGIFWGVLSRLLLLICCNCSPIFDSCCLQPGLVWLVYCTVWHFLSELPSPLLSVKRLDYVDLILISNYWVGVLLVGCSLVDFFFSNLSEEINDFLFSMELLDFLETIPREVQPCDWVTCCFRLFSRWEGFYVFVDCFLGLSSRWEEGLERSEWRSWRWRRDKLGFV
jgi:hypothetical protein